MSLPNVWHLRKVAETSSKSCYICYKPTTSVLITPDNKDFFYVCPGHLKDRGFCSPIIDEAEIAAQKKKEALEREIEKVKKEYEDKIQKQKAKAQETAKDEEKGKSKDDEANADPESKKAQKERDEKIKSVTDADTATKADDSPRIYALHKNFYQMRLDRIRNAEMARRNRERLKNPSTFPAVPKGEL